MDNIESVPEVSAASLKGLGDKSYDRRKSAAQEDYECCIDPLCNNKEFESGLEGWECG